MLNDMFAVLLIDKCFLIGNGNDEVTLPCDLTDSLSRHEIKINSFLGE